MFTACGIMHHKLLTQSSAPENERNYRPKHVELTVIINKICYCCIYLAVYIIINRILKLENVPLLL